MRLFSVLAIALLGLAVLAGCNSNEQSRSSRAAGAPAAPSPGDGVRRVTVPELQEMVKKGEAFIVDVRTEDAYNTAHIRGAKLIPLNDVEKRAGEFPRDKIIVTYCS
ncbi:MAG TPA: rhodanese-like domain-containing protein [Pyrinomonadaceae bacterium]|nr:rhodanese-like domain-containing protein [Pyrinomonadaceae bacterium]